MRPRIKTGLLVFTTSKNKLKRIKIQRLNVVVHYKEKITGNIITKTTIL